MAELLCVLPHMPAFDSCFPLAARLHARGRVKVRVITGPRIRKTEPRVVRAIAGSGIAAEHRSLLDSEVFVLGAMLRADAVLTHSDPIAYGKRTRPRDAYARALAKPVVFVQHGLKQMRLHYAEVPGQAQAYHADLMLLWRALTEAERANVAGDPRIEVTGLLKQNLLPIAPPVPPLAQKIAASRQVVLICHNYGHESALYPDGARDAAFAAWREVFAARPDILFLIRAHRGRKIPDHDAAVGGLVAGLDNVLVSDRHEGLMKFATINDILAVSDRVVTHPSTVVLDALSEGRPVAMLDNHLDELNALPRADSAADFLAWLGADDPLGAGRAVIEAYGDVDANLNRAAAVVEAHLGA